MAVIQLPENKYIKIIYEDSYANDYVFAYLRIYHSESDRLKEKSRASAFETFNGLADYVKGLYDEIDEYVTEHGYTDESVLETDTELYNKIEFASKLEYANARIKENCYIYNTSESSKELSFDDDIISVLKQYGFSEEWLTNPIHIDGGGYFNCGLYDDEELTPEYFYNKVKSLMQNNGYLDD